MLGQNTHSVAFERRVYTGVFLLVAGFLPLVVLGFLFFRSVETRRNQGLFKDAEELVEAEQLHANLKNHLAYMPAFILSGDPSLMSQVNKSEALFQKRVAQMISTSPAQIDKDSLRTIGLLQQRLTLVGKEAMHLRLKGRSLSSIAAFLESQAKPAVIALSDALDRFVELQAADFEASKSRLTRSTHQVFIGLAVVSSLTLLLIGASLMLLVRVMRAKRLADVEREKLFLHEMRISQVRKETVEIVAHDLKNPLAATKLRADLMLRRMQSQPLDTAAFKNDLAAIVRANQSMQNLIRDLLDNAKIEAGKLALDRKDVDVDALLVELQDRYAPLAQEKGLALMVLPSDAPCPKVPADFDRVMQALGNLIGNAIKFTPRGGCITLKATPGPRSLVVTVSDNGPGIPKDQLGIVFDRFWQGNGSAQYGTGLGLAIVKAIAEAHGGGVWAQSEPGSGCDFHFHLPVRLSAVDFLNAPSRAETVFHAHAPTV